MFVTRSIWKGRTKKVKCLEKICVLSGRPRPSAFAHYVETGPKIGYCCGFIFYHLNGWQVSSVSLSDRRLICTRPLCCSSDGLLQIEEAETTTFSVWFHPLPRTLSVNEHFTFFDEKMKMSALWVTSQVKNNVSVDCAQACGQFSLRLKSFTK